MSKGIGRIALLVAAVAVNVVPGVGQFLSGAITNVALGIGLTTVGSAFAFDAAVGTIIGLASIAVGLSAAEKVLGLGPKAPGISPISLDRLNASMNPTAPRIMAFGKHVAMTANVRFTASGGNQ